MNVMSYGRQYPKISVLMSVYNEPIVWIDKAIDSILNQDFTDFEFIIIDDNPSRHELKKYLDEKSSDHRIRILFNKLNLGLTKSLNIGLYECRGEYVARMDADDISLPQRFRRQVDFLDNNTDYIVVGSYIKYFGVGSKFIFGDWIKSKNEDIKAHMMFGSSFAHPSVMIRKSVLTDNNICYDDNYIYGQDYRLWEMLMPYGKFYNIPIVLLKYRISEKQNKRISDAASIKQRKDISLRIISRNADYSFLNRIDLDEIDLSEIKKIRTQLNSKREKDKAAFIEIMQYIYLTNKSIGLCSLRYSWLFSDFWHFSKLNKFRFIFYKCKQIF